MGIDECLINENYLLVILLQLQCMHQYEHQKRQLGVIEQESTTGKLHGFCSLK